MRVTDASEPDYDRSHHYHQTSPFAARWVAHPDAPEGDAFATPFVADYLLDVDVPAATTVRVRVSADERYRLFLDEGSIGVGPERGERDHWHFETYDLNLTAGRHLLRARVHSLGRHRPYAQASVRHAFVLMAEGPLAGSFSTGVAPWRVRRIDGYAPIPVELPRAFVAIGARFRVDATAASASAASPAVPAVYVGPFVLASMRMESPGQWLLAPSTLPAMLERPIDAPPKLRRVEGGDVAAWSAFLASGAPLTIPPGRTVHALLDFEEYHCAYTHLKVDGGRGATVRVAFAEALFEADGHTKRHRDRVDGLKFVGMGDELCCAGAPFTFDPPWWIAGRYVQVSITTGDEPLRLDALRFVGTRYPTTWDSELTLDDVPLRSALPIMRRAMEMCSHETYYDCPYYEQLMYVGDTRLEALVTYAHSRDDRLPRKAVALFDRSRAPDGWTQARSPTKTAQTIPPFSWWWVAMTHDLAMWRDHPAEVRARMPGVRAVMDASYARLEADGLFRPTTGWYFVDWAEGWQGGVPIGGAERPVAPVHFQLAYVARLAAELEEAVGEPLLARRHRERHATLLDAGRRAFFDAGQGRFFDDVAHVHASEHAQAIAVLAGAVADPDEAGRVAQTLTSGDGLRPATIYYSHYVFEALRTLGRVDAIFDRLRLWDGLVAQGFRTTFEQPEPTRSDCHAWGAHPMFHLLATILGIRPAAPGFAAVRIEPQLGPLARLAGRMVHPRGTIEIVATKEAGRHAAEVRLPPGVTGTLHLDGATTPIGAGAME